MPVIYRHHRALLGRLLHHHRPELSTAYVNFDLLSVCQKDVGRNPNDHEELYGEADRARETGTTMD